MSQFEAFCVQPSLETITQLSRHSQKLLLKALPIINAYIKDMQKNVPKGEQNQKIDMKSKMKLMKTITAMIKELQQLKRKLDDCHKLCVRASRVCVARFRYLEGVHATNTINHTQNNMEKLDQPTLQLSSNSVSRSCSHSDSLLDPLYVSVSLRVDHILIDHLLRSGRIHTAQALLQQSSAGNAFAPYCDIDLFNQLYKIADSIKQRDVSKALAWCGENRSRLNKIQSPFEFDLRLQEFLLLVERGKHHDAIEYARKFLKNTIATNTQHNSQQHANITSDANQHQCIERKEEVVRSVSDGAHHPDVVDQDCEDDSKHKSCSDATSADTVLNADPHRLRALQQAMNTLIFFGWEHEHSSHNIDEHSHSDAWHKYKCYFSPSRWHALSCSFLSTALDLNGYPAHSALESIMHIGMTALKTTTCQAQYQRYIKNNKRKLNDITSSPHDSMNDGDNKLSNDTEELDDIDSNPSCPVCLYPLSFLSATYPIAQHSHSRLICRLSGDLMDERNPPLVLPNGYVYSTNALKAMAQQHNSVITCPRTKQQYVLSQARKAFVL